jgi:hypothetical protein
MRVSAAMARWAKVRKLHEMVGDVGHETPLVALLRGAHWRGVLVLIMRLGSGSLARAGRIGSRRAALPHCLGKQ